MVLAGKLFILAFWALAIAGLAGLLGQYSSAMIWAGALVLAAHLMEAVLMHTLWKTQTRAGLADTLLVLVFGFFHLKPLVDEGRAEEEF